MEISINDEEEGKKILKTDKIYYCSLTSKNAKYEYKVIDEKKYIIIKTEEKFVNAWNECHGIKATNDLNLTNSILKLKEELPDSTFYEILEHGNIQDDRILYKVEEELDDEDIKKVIEWCQEFGLPFLGEWGFNKGTKKDYGWFGFTNDIETCFKNNIIGFRIGTFLIGINIIYKTVHCAEALRKIRNGRITNKEIEIGQIGFEKNDIIDEILSTGVKSIENLEKIEQNLEDYINKTIKAAQYHFQLGRKSNKVMYVPQLYAETLLSASMYHVFLWCCSPEKNTLKRCKRCNCFFMTQNAQEKYCNNPCTRYNTSKINNRNVEIIIDEKGE